MARSADPDDPDAAAEQDEPRPFLDHLEELRVTLIRCAFALLLGMTISVVFMKQILELCYRPLRVIGQDPQDYLRTLAVTDSFTLLLQASLFFGLVIALPFCLYFVAQFVLPALTAIERRMLLPVFAGGSVLFLGGVTFCYFVVLPVALKFFIDLAHYYGFQNEWTAANYVSFVVQLLLAFGITFEMPLVILALAKLGMIDASLLATYRRHAIVGICILAALITPTPDALTMSLMAGPMYLLYEGSIWMVRVMERR